MFPLHLRKHGVRDHPRGVTPRARGSLLVVTDELRKHSFIETAQARIVDDGGLPTREMEFERIEDLVPARRDARIPRVRCTAGNPVDRLESHAILNGQAHARGIAAVDRLYGEAPERTVRAVEADGSLMATLAQGTGHGRLRPKRIGSAGSRLEADGKQPVADLVRLREGVPKASLRHVVLAGNVEGGPVVEAAQAWNEVDKGCPTAEAVFACKGELRGLKT